MYAIGLAKVGAHRCFCGGPVVRAFDRAASPKSGPSWALSSFATGCGLQAKSTTAHGQALFAHTSGELNEWTNDGPSERAGSRTANESGYSAARFTRLRTPSTTRQTARVTPKVAR